jgi:hypothetical protein
LIGSTIEGSSFSGLWSQRRWRTPLVQPVEGGHGFVLYDDEGKPRVEFAFASYEDAEVGREKLIEALKNVVTVKGIG